MIFLTISCDSTRFKAGEFLDKMWEEQILKKLAAACGGGNIPLTEETK
jgi:hypothetical protein